MVAGALSARAVGRPRDADRPFWEATQLSGLGRDGSWWLDGCSSKTQRRPLPVSRSLGRQHELELERGGVCKLGDILRGLPSEKSTALWRVGKLASWVFGWRTSQRSQEGR